MRKTRPSALITPGIVALALGLSPQAAPAHPHVFIDAGLEFIFDAERRLAAVQVVWVYDEFYSLMAVADYGMDPGFTGTLTDAERAELAEIYSGWVPGFEGDLYLRAGGVPVALSGPLDTLADLRDGRIVIAHRRALVDRIEVGSEPVIAKVYDPSYFTDYTIAITPRLRGRDDCTVTVIPPDFAHAAEMLSAALSEMLAEGADEYDIEADFPAVGADFAEEVHLTCGG